MLKWILGEPTVTSILGQYRKLKRTPSGERHAVEYRKLQKMVCENQDELYQLIFSGEVQNVYELSELIGFGGHGGSVAKKHNLHWIPFLTRVRERIEELPVFIRSHFEWLDQVHHYWDDQEPDNGIRGVEGSFEVTRWHVGDSVRITVYDATGNSIYFVTNSSGAKQWIAALSETGRQVHKILVGRAYAEVSRCEDEYHVICEDTLTAGRYRSNFTVEQVQQIIAALQ